MVRLTSLRPGSTRSAAAGPAGRVRLFRLTHFVVVLTNVMQLLFMISFLVLLLVQLNGGALSWFVVFSPLWTSDAITTVTGIQEMRRLCAPGESRRRNPIINQINRFKGCLCVAIFKLLLAMRLDSSPGSPWHDLPVRVICLPYYFAAVFRFALHFAKEPITPPDGPAHRTARPGTPVNPVHLMIVVLACRVDGLYPFGKLWAATFWPMWLLFGLLCFASLGAGCLAVGILVTREPRERGQRALFFLCYGILLTITVTGITFLLNLVRFLDGDGSVSYDAIIGPLIGGYTTLLGFYLAFTLVLPRLMLHDVTIAAFSEEDAEEEDGGVLDLVSQQLAPPFLVQQSSTLFKRVNMLEGTMWERYVGGAGQEPAPSAARANEVVAPGVVEDEAMQVADLEMGDGEVAADVAAAAPEACGAAPAAAEASAAPAGAPAVAPAGAPAVAPGAPGAPAIEEYMALQSEIETWVRAQQGPAPPQPKPRRGGSGKTSAQAGGLGVPPEIKTKLQRFVALKQHLAAAACAEAYGACSAVSSSETSIRELPPPTRQPGAPPHSAAPAPAPTAEAGAPAPASKAALGINAAIRAAACGAAAATEMATLSSVGDAIEDLGADESEPNGKEAADSLCWICFEGERDAVLLECGHGGICYACAQRCFKKKGRICPMCRQPVTQVVHIQLEATGEPDRNRGVVRVKQTELPAELQ